MVFNSHFFQDKKITTTLFSTNPPQEIFQVSAAEHLSYITFLHHVKAGKYNVNTMKSEKRECSGS